MIYAVHRPHTLFVLVQTPEAQGRENSLSQDIPFQSETRLFLPDKISRKPNNSGYFAADQRDIPYKEWNDVSFLRAKSAGKEETKKTNEKSSGTKGYDTDGCFCLFIAILNGVGASAARRLYDKGPGQQKPGSPLPRGRPPDQTAVPKIAERNRRIYALRKKGYSLEAISDILGCDSSTVKRNLKSEGGKVNHDIENICGGDESQGSGKGRGPL